MPRAQKGQRFGGRTKGIPNKKTIEAAEKMRRDLVDAKVSGRKLAKETLDDLVVVFMGMTAAYQPAPAGQVKPGANEEKFEKWARLAMEAAKALAPYQSPTFRAIVVAPPPQEQDDEGRPKRFTLTVFEGSRRIPAELVGRAKAVE